MADKTIVPGVDGSSSDDFSMNRGGPFRPSGAGTVVPGGPDGAALPNAHAGAGKPVLGFLYSVSRHAFGEFWPLYLGPNTIGRDAGCDIILQEGTVSGQHATLIIHQEDDGEVYAGIKDNGSTHGVKVNGKSAHFDVAACNNNDIIKIGKAYELLFILVDAKAMGLSPCPSFIETQQAPGPRQVDKRIFSGPAGGRSALSSRLSNPAAGESDRTHAMGEGADSPHNGTVSR